MSTHSSDRLNCALLTGVVAILYFLATPLPAIGIQDGTLFMGAGLGSTPEIAIDEATWDAKSCAASEQLFTCEMVGEPTVGPGPDPESGRNFRASVTLECTP